jgi:hypothetical protein
MEMGMTDKANHMYIKGPGLAAPPDIPENHGSYEAVAALSNAAILESYPDGLFRGKRPLSRYEMYSAVYRAIKYLDDKVAGN